MQITLDIPDIPVQERGLSSTEWVREIAIALFQKEIVTIGTASQIADMHQMEFQALLFERGISIHYDLADYKADIESLREHNWR